MESFLMLHPQSVMCFIGIMCVRPTHTCIIVSNVSTSYFAKKKKWMGENSSLCRCTCGWEILQTKCSCHFSKSCFYKMFTVEWKINAYNTFLIIMGFFFLLLLLLFSHVLLSFFHNFVPLTVSLSHKKTFKFIVIM